MRLEVEEDIHLNWASWTSLDTGVVSFTRDWEAKEPPELWWGADELKLKALKRLDPEHFGLQGGYFGKGELIHFVLPRSRTAGLDLSQGLYVAGSFNGWEAAIGHPEWKMAHGSVKGHACHQLAVPRSQMMHEHFATFKFVTGKGHWIEVPEFTPNTHVDGLGIKNYLFSADRTGRHLFRFTTPLPLNQSKGRALFFNGEGGPDSVRLSPGVFLKNLEVTVPLGAIAGPTETVFRIFAPRAVRVRLFLYPAGEEPPSSGLPLRFSDDLVWEAVVEGNRHGWFYHYTVEGQEGDEAGYFDPEFEVLDPYARAVCGPAGPGIVVEEAFFRREPDGFRPPHWHDLVIAEAHVRDLTANAPVELSDGERFGFRGLRKWVEEEGFYLKELGVNAVELQPVQEFDTVDSRQYAWGYMPVNYFSPASQYCRRADELDQIREFRELVAAFHRRGLAVILDVVYNHVGEPNYLQYLDREYYFLLTPDGRFENHSGCGNTLDASTPMVRRLILDSLVHLMQAYGVDGFRFDLGELIGKETFSWLEPQLKEVKPDVILIAEPWSFRAHIGRELRETGLASWNDGYREYMREYLTLRADAARVASFMQGSPGEWSRFPAQSVNYVASHDDRCWIDKITENGGHDGHRPTATDRRRTHLMAGILMMSVGIPMLASGMDMLKSKGGENNTYLRGDLNAIPYNRMREYSGTVEYFRKWIAFRLGPLGRYLRLDTYPGSDYFVTSTRGHLFGMIYNARFKEGPERLLFVVNPSHEYGEVRFAEEDLRAFQQLADTERWGGPRLDRPHFVVGPDTVEVPPLCCGLFVERG